MPATCAVSIAVMESCIVDFDERRKKMMGFESAKRIIDFLQEIWAESRQRFTNKVLFISFMGESL